MACESRQYNPFSAFPFRRLPFFILVLFVSSISTHLLFYRHQTSVRVRSAIGFLLPHRQLPSNIMLFFGNNHEISRLSTHSEFPRELHEERFILRWVFYTNDLTRSSGHSSVISFASSQLCQPVANLATLELEASSMKVERTYH